jgi:hypothetical protein
MRNVARILLGALITTISLWAAVAFYGLLAARVPFPQAWWVNHPSWVTLGSIALAVVPIVVVVGLVLSRILVRPAVAASLLSTAIAIVVVAVSSISDFSQLLSDAGWMGGFVGGFLVGPPLVVLLAERMRPNKSLERTREG